jgi:hypothetical protein
MGDSGAGPGPDRIDLDGAIRAAHIARQKGELNRARRELRSAAETLAAQEKRPNGVGPSHVAELARALIELDEAEAAKAAADWGRERFPGDLMVNDAYGEAVLAEKGALPDGAEATMADYAGAKSAVLLSAFLPGLGHLILDRRTSAAMFSIGWIISVVATFLIPDGLSGLGSVLRGASAPFNAVVLLPLASAVGLHLCAVGDATRLANQRQPKKIERIAPPVDKDYELKR